MIKTEFNLTNLTNLNDQLEFNLTNTFMILDCPID